MKQLVVTGYASLDYVVTLAGDIARNQTTQIVNRTAWPRAGGSPTYVARAARRAGQLAAPITWIGSDPMAEALFGHYRAAGLLTDGVARVPGPSPISLLAYQTDGAVSCLYDPAFAGEERLTPEQSALIGVASHVCITVGPDHLTASILDLLPAEARLYWVTKNDLKAFPPAACQTLAARADVVFCNHDEIEMIEGFRDTAIITHGGEGVEIAQSDGRRRCMAPLRVLNVADTTGAGDTFAGAYIAAEMDGVSSPTVAAEAGATAAWQMLKERETKKGQTP